MYRRRHRRTCIRCRCFIAARQHEMTAHREDAEEEDKEDENLMQEEKSLGITSRRMLRLGLARCAVPAAAIGRRPPMSPLIRPPPGGGGGGGCGGSVFESNAFSSTHKRRHAYDPSRRDQKATYVDGIRRRQFRSLPRGTFGHLGAGTFPQTKSIRSVFRKSMCRRRRRTRTAPGQWWRRRCKTARTCQPAASTRDGNVEGLS